MRAIGAARVTLSMNAQQIDEVATSANSSKAKGDSLSLPLYLRVVAGYLSSLQSLNLNAWTRSHSSWVWVWVEGQNIVWVGDEHKAVESPKLGGVIVARVQTRGDGPFGPPRPRDVCCLNHRSYRDFSYIVIISSIITSGI